MRCVGRWTRIAHEVLERNKGAQDLILIGIETRGACMAKRLAANIERFENLPVAVGTIDPAGYRDDVRRNGGEAGLRSRHPGGHTVQARDPGGRRSLHQAGRSERPLTR